MKEKKLPKIVTYVPLAPSHSITRPLRPGLKGPGQEHSLDFSLKLNMAKTAPNFACQFVYTCGKLPCTYFPPFLLRISELKYAKTLACHSRPLLELLCYTMKENSLLFSNTVTISVVFLLIFFQMIT